MIVLDTSVILKWFVSEENDIIAEKIKRDFILGIEEITIPEFLLIEVSNVLRYKPTFNKKVTKDALNTIIDMDMNIVIPTISIYESTIDIAFKYDITIYDALYVALAKELECPLITADEKLIKKLPSEFEIKLLKDLGNE